jgi:hypothetical protein
MNPGRLFFLAALACAPAFAADLTVEIRRGGVLAARSGEIDKRKIEAVVTGASGEPVSGATVTFSLPPEGPGGRFPSGLLNERVVTGQDGTASVAGIAWNDQPGTLLLHVIARKGGDGGAAVMTIKLEPGRGKKTVERKSGGKRWIFIAAAAGGAVAGLAFAGGGSSGNTVNPTVSNAPMLGMPAISVGRP